MTSNCLRTTTIFVFILFLSESPLLSNRAYNLYFVDLDCARKKIPIAQIFIFLLRVIFL